MKKTSYKVTTAEGNIETRKSARPYVAVLLGRPDYVALRARMNSKDYANNFAYYTKVAEGRYEWSRWDTAEEIARSVEKAKTEVAGFADAKTYGEAKVAKYIAENCPEGQDQGEEVALRWSQSVANAQGAISEFQGRFYTAFRVVPAEVATTTTNRAGATPGNKESNMNTAATTTEKTTTTKKATKTAKPATKKQPAKKAATKKASTKTSPKVATKVAAKKTAPKVTKAAKPATESKVSRKGTIIALISRPTGATLNEIMEATGWQAHSVRGTISILSKTLTITSDKTSSGERVYTAEAKVA
jgi:hypothetical protein